MHAGGCDCKISVYSFCTGNRNPVLYMGKQALQRMDGRNDCGNYNDRDEYIGTSDSEYGEKGIDPWHQRRCDRVCTGSIVPLWNRNGQSDFPERHKNRVEEEGVETMVGMDPQGRIHAFAEAVDELSVAFAAMDGRQKPKQQDHLDILAQEITGKLCADCDGCVVCLEQQKPDFWIKIRRMLQAVAQHSTKEEILSQNFMEECPRYSGMVEEAIWAFSRMELNEAWYHRLQENRKVIADQLDAMADALQDWDQGIRCMDRTERVLLAKIAFETRERGLDVKQIHVYEDKEKRRMVTALVASKWGGGIPVKNYRKALERASGMAVWLKEDTRSILTQEPVMITAYEDTCFLCIIRGCFGKRRGIKCQWR